jgi:transcriptional regulator with XRE-family HTH domain
MSTKSEELAHRMRILRAVWGWSAEQLAEEVSRHGVPWSRSVVTNVENGSRDHMTVDELFALAAAFQIPPITFFSDGMLMGVIESALETASLMQDPDFVESLEQMRRGETVPALTSLERARVAEAEEGEDVPGTE